MKVYGLTKPILQFLYRSCLGVKTLSLLMFPLLVLKTHGPIPVSGA